VVYNSADRRDESAFTVNINQTRDKSGASNSTSGTNGCLKVINKKLITLTAKKVQKRIDTVGINPTTTVSSLNNNIVSHLSIDK
jgi:hypothetical protein